MARGMRVQMNLVGAKRTRAVLNTKERDCKRAVRKGVIEWAQLAVSIMKSFVPVRSGKLRDAIEVDSVDQVPGGYSAFVGPGNRVRYAGFVEYGTHDTPEQPYARPTNQVAHQIGTREITKAVRRAL